MTTMAGCYLYIETTTYTTYDDMTVIPTTNIFAIASTHDICSAALQDLSKNGFSRSQDPRPAFSFVVSHNEI